MPSMNPEHLKQLRALPVNDLLARAEHIVERQGGENADRLDLLISIGRQYSIQDEHAKARRVLQDAYDLSRKITERGSVRGRRAPWRRRSAVGATSLARRRWSRRGWTRWATSRRTRSTTCSVSCAAATSRVNVERQRTRSHARWRHSVS